MQAPPALNKAGSEGQGQYQDGLKYTISLKGTGPKFIQILYNTLEMSICWQQYDNGVISLGDIW